MRTPQDRLGQRVLVYELRHAIDRARRRPWDTEAHARVARLLSENPRTSRNSHVLHNLGITRREWLEANGMGAHTRPLLPSGRDARSLGAAARDELGIGG